MAFAITDTFEPVAGGEAQRMSQKVHIEAARAKRDSGNKYEWDDATIEDVIMGYLYNSAPSILVETTASLNHHLLDMNPDWPLTTNKMGQYMSGLFGSEPEARKGSNWQMDVLRRLVRPNN